MATSNLSVARLQPKSCSSADPATLPQGPRVVVASRACADVADVLGVLSLYNFVEVPPAVLQMVQQRAHELALGAVSALADPEPIEEIHARVWPSERAAADGGAQ